MADKPVIFSPQEDSMRERLTGEELAEFRAWLAENDERGGVASKCLATIDHYRSLLREAVEALEEAVSDLAISVEDHYLGAREGAAKDGEIHPAMKRKYERDMAPISGMRALLSRINDALGEG